LSDQPLRDAKYEKNQNCQYRIMAVKKGDVVRAVREKLENSLEAKASDSRFSPYIFETKGQVVDIKGDYALVMFGQVSTPNIWLRVDQLEPFK
jgi:hypothetical protein